MTIGPDYIEGRTALTGQPFPERQRLLAENAALREKYDRLREECIFEYYDSERGYLERCKVCLCEWLDGEPHKHDGWCPLAEDGNDDNGR